MSKMFFSSQNCQGATLESGSHFKTGKDGLIDVSNASSADIKALQAGGYVMAGSIRARSGTYWVCDPCARDCNLNHCSKCDSSDLRKVKP